MRWQYRRVVVASLAVLPAVESLCAPASSCRQTIHSNRWISRAGTRTSSISSSGSNRAPRRAEHEPSVPRGTHFRMQDGAGYGTDGEGKLDAIKYAIKPSSGLSTSTRVQHSSLSCATLLCSMIAGSTAVPVQYSNSLPSGRIYALCLTSTCFRMQRRGWLWKRKVSLMPSNTPSTSIRLANTPSTSIRLENEQTYTCRA